MKYKLKAKEVEAIRFTGDNCEKILLFAGNLKCPYLYDQKDMSLTFPDWTGEEHRLKRLDWMVKTSSGGLCTMTPEEFDKAVDKEPTVIAVEALFKHRDELNKWADENKFKHLRELKIVFLEEDAAILTCQHYLTEKACRELLAIFERKFKQ